MTQPISKAGAEAGYTYVTVLLLVFAVALGAQAARVPTESARISDREAELLFRGTAYREAIEAFYRADPENPRFPAELSDLTQDPRDETLRHIRRLYKDPITGQAFRLIRKDDDTITGVRSTSSEKPRQSFFASETNAAFNDATRYADWEFIFDPEDEN